MRLLGRIEAGGGLAIPSSDLLLLRLVQALDEGTEFFGEQFRGTYQIRTLLEPYTVAPDLPGPRCTLLLYEGDQIVFCAGAQWNGTYPAGSDLRQFWDTHSNTLTAAGGKPFVFARPGRYTMRLVVENGAGWHDVLDVHEAQFTVPPPAARPASTRGSGPRSR